MQTNRKRRMRKSQSETHKTIVIIIVAVITTDLIFINYGHCFHFCAFLLARNIFICVLVIRIIIVPSKMYICFHFFAISLFLFSAAAAWWCQDPKAPGTIDYVKPEADHRLRHRRFIRQHLHDLDVVQKAMKRQLNELHHHRIGERLHGLETEQKRLANANFNMSRQVASLDRLHGSMLELLEDIEGIQNKFDKTIPDIKREISKVEFNAAQVASEYGLLREENHNAAKSIQALAVSVSALQDDRDVVKRLDQTVNELKHNFTRIRAGANAHRHMFHKRIEKVSGGVSHPTFFSQFEIQIQF